MHIKSKLLVLLLASVATLPAAFAEDVQLRLDETANFEVRYDTSTGEHGYDPQYLQITSDANGKSYRVYTDIGYVEHRVDPSANKMQTLMSFLPSVWRGDTYMNITCDTSTMAKGTCKYAGFGVFKNN